jgi:MFS family permease
MYGLILGGDLAGSGFGYLVSGDLSALTTWRVAFWWLAVPSLALAWVVWRLPEPARGGSSRLAVGATEIRDERDVAADDELRTPEGEKPDALKPGLAQRALIDTDVRPQEELVLRSDPTDRSLWWAIRYILRVRTNVVIIIASALGYFYFAGLRSFAVIFATGHYGISKPTATTLIVVLGAGALAGVYAGGRFADRLLRRGHVRARVLVPAVCLLALTPVLAPAIATPAVAIALPLLLVGAFLLGAPNPPLDAARLDIMPAGLWGRAEGVRTALRSVGEAAAPLLFGYVSQYVFGGPGSASGNPAGSGGGSAAQATGLEHTFLFFLIPLLAAGLLALAGLRTYPRDVATATASARVIGRAAGRGEDARSRPAA